MTNSKKVKTREEFGVELGDINAIKLYEATYNKDKKKSNNNEKKEK